MRRLTISKRETVTQFNDNLMAQFNEGRGHKRIRTLKIFEFENTRSHVKKCFDHWETSNTEKQVTMNMAGRP